MLPAVLSALQRRRLEVITVKHCYSVIFGSATREGEDETGKKKKELMMWLKHGPAVLK